MFRRQSRAFCAESSAQLGDIEAVARGAGLIREPAAELSQDVARGDPKNRDQGNRGRDFETD